MSKVKLARPETEPIKARKSPCSSCPYRRDVPSGIWAAEEYELLPNFDGEIMEQVEAGATHLFFCHQQDGHLCSGWVGCHGTDAIAIRVNSHRLDESVFTYESPVPLFASGREACDHGMRDIESPSEAAMQTVTKIVKVQRARNGRFQRAESS